MKVLKKPDLFAPAFEIANCSTESTGTTCKTCGHPVSSHSEGLIVKEGVKMPDGRLLPDRVVLPQKLEPGKDYFVVIDGVDGMLRTGPMSDDALGGFHVGLDGKILPHSIWDRNWKPKCADPRGMVLVGGTFWVDIYLLNSDPETNGTSRAGVEIADGSAPPKKRLGGRAEKLSWFEATEVFAAHGKQLLSVPEFELAMRGVEENAACGADPEFTCHVPGQRSEWGIEQATGCMWTWSRDQDENGFCRVLGGSWGSIVAGPRRLNLDVADFSYGLIGARGRCDHLILG